MTNNPIHPQTEEAREFADKLLELAVASPEKIALLVKADDSPVQLNSDQSMRLRSVYKMAIGLAYAREVVNNPEFASQSVPVTEIDASKPGYYDGGGNDAWKATLPTNAQFVTHADTARGMLQQSCNACTQYMLNIIGADKVNALLDELGLSSQRFSSSYDELNAPMHGSAADISLLIDDIATKESPPVRQAFLNVALPFAVRSVNNGEAQGFGKGGSGIIPGPHGDSIHDFNYSWHVTHNGKPVSVTLHANDLDTPTKEYLEKRFASFACEISCNPDFRKELDASPQRADGNAWSASLGDRTGRVPIK